MQKIQQKVSPWIWFTLRVIIQFFRHNRNACLAMIINSVMSTNILSLLFKFTVIDLLKFTHFKCRTSRSEDHDICDDISSTRTILTLRTEKDVMRCTAILTVIKFIEVDINSCLTGIFNILKQKSCVT